MMKAARVLAISSIVTVFYAVPLYAGIPGKIQTWITGEMFAVILSGILAVLAGGFGYLFIRVIRTFKEAGEFLVSLSTALEDRRITREELAALIRQGRDIFKVWS